MRSRTFVSLAPLALAVAALGARRAEAQTRVPVIVCRDRTQLASEDVRVCSNHGGVDVRATEAARQYKAGPSADNRNDGQYTTRKYGGTQGGVYDNRNSNNNVYNNGTYNNGGYNGYGAGSTEVYEWQGRVDAEIRLQLRGNRAVVQRIGSNESRVGGGRMVNSLPQQNGTLVVQTLDGRGAVDVIEQPNANNGYTAVVRLRDPQNGAANYHIAAYWQPNQNGYGRNNGRNGGYNGRRP